MGACVPDTGWLPLFVSEHDPGLVEELEGDWLVVFQLAGKCNWVPETLQAFFNLQTGVEASSSGRCITALWSKGGFCGAVAAAAGLCACLRGRLCSCGC